MLPAQQGCEAMDKSEDAFRTISEAAEELDLPQHVLRFWETRFPQIRPLKRGGGRRYYRPDDVELLRVIRHLLYSDGYTIKGVQRMLKERGVRAVLEVRNEAAAAQTRASEAAPAQPESAQLALSPEPPRTHGSVATAPSGIRLGAPIRRAGRYERRRRSGPTRGVQRGRWLGHARPLGSLHAARAPGFVRTGSQHARGHRGRTRRVPTNTGRRKHLMSVFRLRQRRPASIRPPVGV